MERPRRSTDELKTSERYYNYAKTLGAVIAAATGVFGMVVAVWHPSEPVAKAGYQAVETVVAGLSSDAKLAFEDRKLIKERLDNLQGQMKLLLDTVHAYMEARPVTRPSGRRPASTTSDVLRKQPDELLKAALTQQRESSKRREKNTQQEQKLSQPPPIRALPSLERVQAKLAE